jgi:hypothetical protein
MSYVRKAFSSGADVVGGAKYIDELAAAVKVGAKRADELTAAKSAFKESFEASLGNKTFKDGLVGALGELPDDKFIDIMKKLPDGAADDLFEAGSEASQRAKKLLGGADEGADAAGTAGSVSKKADDINPENIDSLKQLDSLPGPQRKIADEAISKKYAEMSVDSRKMMGDEFLDAGEEGMNTFKKLPKSAQADIIAANPKLRWKAGETPVGFEWVKGACKNHPIMCATGVTGGIALAGYVAKEIHDKVKEVFDDKEEEKQACIATCLPEKFFSSKVSGYGTLEYKDLEFRTIADIKKATGNNNITESNTPMCTADMDPPEKCQEMCVKRCDLIHQSFLESLAKGAGSLARDVVEEGSKVAGTGIKGVLDGFFGEGMGIASAAGIFIVFIVIIIISTTL